jgi:hypothetical protein
MAAEWKMGNCSDLAGKRKEMEDLSSNGEG